LGNSCVGKRNRDGFGNSDSDESYCRMPEALSTSSTASGRDGG
jgi:hypothetical protein